MRKNLKIYIPQTNGRPTKCVQRSTQTSCDMFQSTQKKPSPVSSQINKGKDLHFL